MDNAESILEMVQRLTQNHPQHNSGGLETMDLKLPPKEPLLGGVSPGNLGLLFNDDVDAWPARLSDYAGVKFLG